MTTSPIRVALLLVIAVLVVLPACKRHRPVTQHAKFGDGPLEELALVYEALAAEKAAAPGSAKSLQRYKVSLPTALPKIEKGEIIVQWGAGKATGGDASKTVLAYEKAAETAGGKVLMQDLTVKEMSAAEFKSAPKAK